MRSRILELWWLMLLAGCAARPLSEEVAVRSLMIRNPEGLEVGVRRVGGGRIEVGVGEQVRLDLESARYVVEAGGSEWPVPLIADLLPNGRALEVKVGERGAAPDGFVLIPGGPTLVGDVLGVGAVDERPARIEPVEAFFVATLETSNAQFVEFLNAKGRCDDDWIDMGGPKCRVARADSGVFETDAPNWPVVTVSYLGAVEYCAWKSQSSGQVHRLPTEVEWERMARGPSSTTYAYGDVYDMGAANQESGMLMATQSFPATGWGVHDATGNAFEWTSSEYASGLQVLKGGSYVLDGPYLRNSFRMWYRPKVQADDIGFRVVREVTQ